jgi:predicted  nucleic acid-binding Zn-ribbon protein
MCVCASHLVSLSQERASLVSVNEALTQQLSGARDAEGATQAQCKELTRRLEQTQRELNQAKAEVGRV